MDECRRFASQSPAAASSASTCPVPADATFPPRLHCHPDRHPLQSSSAFPHHHHPHHALPPPAAARWDAAVTSPLTSSPPPHIKREVIQLPGDGGGGGVLDNRSDDVGWAYLSPSNGGDRHVTTNHGLGSLYFLDDREYRIALSTPNY